MKVAINREVGSFHLSIWGALEYLKRKGIVGYAYVEELTDDEFICKRWDPDTVDNLSYLISTNDQGDIFPVSDFNYEFNFSPFGDIDIRTDSVLIELVEQFPDKVAERPNSIKLVEIPDGIEFEINESEDGCEWIAEKHRTWH